MIAALLSAASVLLLGPPRVEIERAPERTELLPPLGDAGTMTLEEALRRRRSVRTFSPRALTSAEIGRLLWSAQGITDAASGGRAAPSAGAIHPLEVLVVTPEGVFRYAPSRHALERRISGDPRAALARAALGQEAVRGAAASIVLAGNIGKTATKYGARAERFVLLEAGHAAQNVLLEAVALGLDAVPIGAFTDADVVQAVGLRADEAPLYILAVGAPAR